MQILRSRIPVGLVFAVHLMAECRALAVHGDDEVIKAVVFYQHENCVEKPEEGRDIVVLAVSQRMGEKGEIASVYQGIAIHDI